MSALITGDLHLTTQPSDEHRWGLFEWLCQQGQELGVDDLILLGDYTNPKDNHPAALVNRFTTCVERCCNTFNYVIMLAGNHDYIDPKCPFFKFLDGIGYYSVDGKIAFVSQPRHFNMPIGECLMIPAGFDWTQLAANPNLILREEVKYIFTHATFDGAISETGHPLAGVPPSIVDKIGIPVISGDIHKPQSIGRLIEYVGSPYHTRFGGDYTPHIMLLKDDGTRKYLFYPAPLKKTYVITSLDDLDKLQISGDDHTKIRVHLDLGQLTDWQKIRDGVKARAEAQGWQLTGPELILKPQEAGEKVTESSEARSPEQLMADYVKRHNGSDQHIEVGKTLL
jgi:hypothetical protein